MCIYDAFITNFTNVIIDIVPMGLAEMFSINMIIKICESNMHIS